MIKFIRKKHVKDEGKKGKFIIYYSPLDIILGIILGALVIFFIHDYLSHSLNKRQSNCIYSSKTALFGNKNILNKK